MHFHRHSLLTDSKLTLRLSGHNLAQGPTCKYLGVVIDCQLTWKAQIKYLEKKSSAKVAILSTLAGSTWCIDIENLRCLYLPTMLSQFIYCSSVWYVSNMGYGFKQKKSVTIQFMRGIQTSAARILAGAFRTTLGAALDVELYLLPVQNEIEIAFYDSRFCIVISPTYGLIKSQQTLTNRILFPSRS